MLEKNKNELWQNILLTIENEDIFENILFLQINLRGIILTCCIIIY